MPLAFPLGSSSIPATPAAAPTPMNSVQNNRIRRAVWYLDFVCIYISPIHHKVPQPDKDGHILSFPEQKCQKHA